MPERRRITRSRARCTKCGAIVESKHAHDFVSCPCGSIFLDGGPDYVRYGWQDPADLELMTEYADDRRPTEGFDAGSADLRHRPAEVIEP